MGVLFVAGCSSTLPPPQSEKMPVPNEEQELMTTKPRTEAALEIELDPEPEPEAQPEEIVMEPEAEPAIAACLPATAAITSTLEPQALRICWNQVGDVLAGDDVCLWIGKDGKTRAGAIPAFPQSTRARIAVTADGKAAELCDAEGACRTLSPGDGTVQQAVVDRDGATAALLVTGGKDASVSLYDARDGSVVAAGSRSMHRDTSYAIDVVGPAVLWLEYRGDSTVAKAEMWKTKVPKLKKRKSIGEVRAWGSISDERLAFLGKRLRATVWDMHTAKQVLKVDLGDLVEGKKEKAAWKAEDEDAATLMTSPGAFAVLVRTEAAARVAFVNASERHAKPTLFDVPRCE
jgi:hypothetical protein